MDKPRRKMLSTRNIYGFVGLFIIGSLLFAIVESGLQGNWTVLFTSVLILILSLIPLFFRRKFKVKIPTEIELVIVIFIYATLFLGELQDFYNVFWWWDLLLHAGSAIVFGFIGFTLLYLMYSKESVGARPLALSIFSFSFAIAIGTMWEILEFSLDQLFGFNMQKSGLLDTMTDLIIDAVGAVFASSVAFVYFKTKKTLIFDGLIKKLRPRRDENLGRF
jgi:hypothetical protein